jgi:hypothetical protein
MQVIFKGLFPDVVPTGKRNSVPGEPIALWNFPVIVPDEYDKLPDVPFVIIRVFAPVIMFPLVIVSIFATERFPDNETPDALLIFRLLRFDTLDGI